jgi:EAL domain-containing protein (putative c-di-GMP-specific phosphodiesterase class I)
MATGQMVAAEALLRWKDPAPGRHALVDLIVAAERTPVIYALEDSVAGQACREAAAWQRGPLRHLRLNLNVSARELDSAAAVDRLRRRVRASGIDPRRLTLEITETAAIHELEQVAPLLGRLKADGVELWLDDFGTGHSSMAWLLYLPIDGLKLPDLLVREVAGRSKAGVIVPALIGMAHQLGLRVVAEGVETKAQLSWLRAHRCDAVQGRWLYDAMEPEGLANALARGATADGSVWRRASSSRP